MSTGYVLIGVALLIAVWAVLVYNGLVRSRNKVDEAWSGVDVQLKRRHDLVPNLVETVKGYAAHERETLAHVSQARARAIAAEDPAETGRAETSLSAASARYARTPRTTPSCAPPRASGGCRASSRNSGRVRCEPLSVVCADSLTS